MQVMLPLLRHMDTNFIQSEQDAAISAQLAVVGSVRSSTKETYETVVRWLVYGAAILVPLFYLPFSSSYLELNKQMLLVVVAAVGLIVWLLGVVVTGRLTIRTSPLDKGVYAVLVAAIIATALSLTPLKSVFGLAGSLSSSLLSVIALSVFYFLVVNSLHDRGQILRRVLLVSVGATLIIGVCQMLTWYFLPGGFTHSRAFQTIGSLNTLGLLAAIALPLFAKAGRGSRLSGMVKMVGVALSVIILAILNWWVLWAIALAGMLAMIALDSLNASQLAEEYGSRARRSTLARFIVPMIVIVVGAFLLLVKFNPVNIRGQFPIEIAPSFQLSWQVTENVLKNRPVTGYGPENFSLAFDQFGVRSLANTQFASTKFYDGISEVSSLIVQNGIIGLLALLLLIWSLVQVMMRFGGTIAESVTRGEKATFAFEASGVLASTIALAVAMFLYPWSLSIQLIWYALLALASLVIASNRSRTIDIEARPFYSLATSLSFIVGLILVLTGAYFFTVRYIADIAFARAMSQQDPAVALDQVVKAINLKTDDYYLRTASQLTLRVLQAEIAKPSAQRDADYTAHIQNLLASAVQLAQKATALQPREADNWNNLGLVYQSMTGFVDNVEGLAEESFNKAAELRSGDPTYANQIGTMWLTRADLLRQAGSKDAKLISDALNQAEKSFKAAIDISLSFGRAIYNLGAVYDRQNKVPEAIKQLEKIAPYNANEPTLMFELGLLYIRNGQKDTAIAALRRAALLAPQFANARWYLALLLEEKGDITGALDQLHQIEKDNPDNTDLKQKIAQLEAGQRTIPPAKVIDSGPLQ